MGDKMEISQDLIDMKTKDLLPFYYTNLFPFESMYQWLSHGSDIEWNHREWSFTKGEIYSRHNSFSNMKAWKDEVLRRCPDKLDIGAVYNAPPSQHRMIENLQPLNKELVFDIDATDYSKAGVMVAQEASEFITSLTWPIMYATVATVDRLLRTDFGFKHIMWVFSGRRGVHCWVCDKRARELDNSGRSAVAEYLQVIIGSEGAKKKLNIKNSDQLHPSLQDIYDSILLPLWEEEFVDKQKVMCNPVHLEKILEFVPESVKTRYEGHGYTDSGDRWRCLVECVEEHQSKERFRKSNPIVEIIFNYTYPRLDIDVSKQLNHLLKAPFAVHPSTENAKYFKPEDVPTVAGLMTEINRNAKKSKGPVNYKDTALAKPCHILSEFVRSLSGDRDQTSRGLQIFALEDQDVPMEEEDTSHVAPTWEGVSHQTSLSDNPQEHQVTYNIFVGELSPQVKQEDLWNAFSPCGPIHSVNIQHDRLTGSFLGYGFIHFLDRESQQTALKPPYANQTILGQRCRVNPSDDKNTLFVGNLPFELREDQVRSELEALVGACQRVELKTGPPPELESRGFAFVTFVDRQAAETAKRILSQKSIRGFNLNVKWAEVRREVTPETMAAVTTLYISNVHKYIQPHILKAYYSQWGTVTNSVIVKDPQGGSKGFGFITFEFGEKLLLLSQEFQAMTISTGPGSQNSAQSSIKPVFFGTWPAVHGATQTVHLYSQMLEHRADCEQALTYSNNQTFCGQALVVTLAKPIAEGSGSKKDLVRLGKSGARGGQNVRGGLGGRGGYSTGSRMTAGKNSQKNGSSGRGGALGGYDQAYQYGQWAQPGAGGYSQTGGYPAYGQPYGQPTYYGSDGPWNQQYYQGYGQPYQSYSSTYPGAASYTTAGYTAPNPGAPAPSGQQPTYQQYSQQPGNGWQGSW